MSKEQVFKGPTAYEKAHIKARYGHRDWIVYSGIDKIPTAEKLSAASVKRALLACGTQRRFSRFCASNGCPHIHTWKSGINLLNNARYYEQHGDLYR
jgi:hypothetical protein